MQRRDPAHLSVKAGARQLVPHNGKAARAALRRGFAICTPRRGTLIYWALAQDFLPPAVEGLF